MAIADASTAMYDYEFILRLFDRSDRLQDDLKKSIGHLTSDGSGNGLADEIIDLVWSHYSLYHPRPMIVETEPSGVITFVNDEFASRTEYPREELVGQNINVLRSSKMESGLFTDMWNHLLEGRPWRGQIQNRTKNYRTYWIDTLILPVFDSTGQIIKYWSLSFDITEQQQHKEEIELINKDITESLRYAKRIQRTILPSKKDMDEVLEDYFVLYKPKDIVSGDFYWFAKTVNKAFLAVVDCTGHGVPGAFMSLIGYNLLNQIVLGKHVHRPGEILSELHREIRSTLKQDKDETENKDGMDVSLLVFDRYGEGIEYAGAFRPLYWWKGNDLHVIDGDKMSIGGEQLEEERIFTNHEFEVETDHILYMFSDGLPDQFGGPEHKKFSTKRLRQLIAQNHHESMSVQRALFNIVWKEWKADLEQTDDVTMIGIRF